MLWSTLRNGAHKCTFFDQSLCISGGFRLTTKEGARTGVSVLSVRVGAIMPGRNPESCFSSTIARKPYVRMTGHGPDTSPDSPDTVGGNLPNRSPSHMIKSHSNSAPGVTELGLFFNRIPASRIFVPEMTRISAEKAWFVTERVTGRLTTGFPVEFSPPFGRWGGGTRETWLQSLRWPQIQARTPDFGGPTSRPDRSGHPRTRHGHGLDKPGAATDITDTTDTPAKPEKHRAAKAHRPKQSCRKLLFRAPSPGTSHQGPFDDRAPYIGQDKPTGSVRVDTP